MNVHKFYTKTCPKHYFKDVNSANLASSLGTNVIFSFNIYRMEDRKI